MKTIEVQSVGKRKILKLYPRRGCEGERICKGLPFIYGTLLRILIRVRGIIVDMIMHFWVFRLRLSPHMSKTTDKNKIFSHVHTMDYYLKHILVHVAQCKLGVDLELRRGLAQEVESSQGGSPLPRLSSDFLTQN